ncbi:hypothetical protein M6B38_249745 [Iris pallida]|uniref:Uncharacterized protein n=1 Tax=Iris pallida TaxID=29817 RepID=A0AAX6IM72_IRIPA|nr:hypothetical protein M6B38_249745 [Iris pallida]
MVPSPYSARQPLPPSPRTPIWMSFELGFRFPPSKLIRLKFSS